MSQTIREQILVEENHRRSMAALPHAYRPSTALTLPPLEEAPHFMRETMSFISLVSSTPVKPRVHPSQIKEVDWKNKPRYMQETTSYKKYVETEEERRHVTPKEIKEVDWEHKPRYMQETQSFRQKLEKEEQRRHVSPKEIKEVDWKNKPRYMEPTKAYRQSIAPVEEYHPRRVKPSQIKPVDTGRLPRYMQLTKATQAMQSGQDAKPAQQSARSVTRQPTNAAAKPLPNFMRSTKSCQSSLDNRLREEEARRKKKEERDHQQEELKALQNRWKRNQETLQSLREKK